MGGGIKRHHKPSMKKVLSFLPSFLFFKEESLLQTSWLRLISDLWLKPAAGCGYGKVQSICTTPSTLMASLPFGHPHGCFSHQRMMSLAYGGGNTLVKSQLQSFLHRCSEQSSKMVKEAKFFFCYGLTKIWWFEAFNACEEMLGWRDSHSK